jgi:hypothetical protein
VLSLLDPHPVTILMKSIADGLSGKSELKKPDHAARIAAKLARGKAISSTDFT